MTDADATFGAAQAIDSATATKYYEQGLAAETECDRPAAIKAYQAAYTANPDDANICFRLAYALDVTGEEDEALHLYEECIKADKPHLNALINLAILYEDRNELSKAERCIRQVLATSPNHPRASLYIKDIIASKAMIIDDEAEKRNEKHMVLLDTPVTDFELSVRTRNALRKMNIRTLGDLLKVTEAELRSFKNFGDASLEEIKAMLAQKGLRLGQSVEQHQQAVKEQVYEQLADSQGDNEMLSRPIADLNLSVRARKALALLNVSCIGDVVLRTEAELMGVKNFGMTSLLEIKEKLAEMGMGLRTLEG
ncbi:DNA-directed RNA polymerase subunit alpha [Poriferisphaera corsica]|uniref:DNA-directed RNA polymerase subunit alpha n=1 Tax=Poriferisphaera corsica TaxID=2528020 RepID=A0A517YT65_9BACT|nr:DNA-directed RNA polymerase subunit alpha C-terminal domain-containing protein [Poriferisphaera corsica]QDU33433.1 DNA-directed RNA polymerase subunit alpha [Poriferisphaera corsica]